MFANYFVNVLGLLFLCLEVFAFIKRENSRYLNNKNECNPFEGKKVVFIENDNNEINADGRKGYLKEVGCIEVKYTFYTKYIKRLLDIILSFFGLLILSPIFLVIIVAIYIDDPGPILFTQKRVGKNKQYFKLHKFRSMKMSTPHDIPTHMLGDSDNYITKVGKFIRSHSLDELPQIWDIFIGNMSIVGPRPALWNQDVLVAERDKYNANYIKPGLTGWAQVNGRDELEISDKAKLDGDYVKKISFMIDLKIFLMTIHVFKGDDTIVEGGMKK